ncbi:TadE-like protein [Sphingomonas gellani]|uniref:TadE-like protein n=1 Tax=Sphingomonas gellani TaxID=1166340 RepID=A0A1H8EWQ6_9SPHN|nr:TadE family protein [Sphingomonas gellani]SEN23899.1 TadE-like protein [Sphingomonas gellani]
MRQIPTLSRRLRSDRRGITIVEFAIVAPVMCLFLVGSFDIAHTLYLQAALQGIVQKTARDSGLETATPDIQAALDKKVERQVLMLMNKAKVSFERRSYRTFAAASNKTPEDYTDTNGDGRCDDNEPYVDANNNKMWDSDGGNGAQGGAKDKTVYTVTARYARLLPLNHFINVPADQVIVAKTVLQNQPYSEQSTIGTTVLNCP